MHLAWNIAANILFFAVNHGFYNKYINPTTIACQVFLPQNKLTRESNIGERMADDEQKRHSQY